MPNIVANKGAKSGFLKTSPWSFFQLTSSALIIDFCLFYVRPISSSFISAFTLLSSRFAYLLELINSTFLKSLWIVLPRSELNNNSDTTIVSNEYKIEAMWILLSSVFM